MNNRGRWERQKVEEELVEEGRRLLCEQRQLSWMTAKRAQLGRVTLFHFLTAEHTQRHILTQQT